METKRKAQKGQNKDKADKMKLMNDPFKKPIKMKKILNTAKARKTSFNNNQSLMSKEDTSKEADKCLEKRQDKTPKLKKEGKQSNRRRNPPKTLNQVELVISDRFYDKMDEVIEVLRRLESKIDNLHTFPI